MVFEVVGRYWQPFLQAVGGELFTKFLPPDTKMFEGGELNRSVSPLMQLFSGGVSHTPVCALYVEPSAQPVPLRMTEIVKFGSIRFPLK
ncbi:hypothetical protein EGV94_21940 [Pseudomonas aeruginosa]|nr:hypothetical protein EGV94_21940 [Pseudomonas aeruginosa]QBL25815.1 hypothetical protein C9I70_25410 [Pseudomonas aeruginosa]